MRFKLYDEIDSKAVTDFNMRLQSARPRYHFRIVYPELRHIEGKPVYEDLYVYRDDDAVHGVYTLKRQDYFIQGQMRPVGDLKAPVSEGIINPHYSMVAIQLLKDALKRTPLLYGLGMGGRELPLPKMFKAMQWHMYDVPFYFKVNHPNRFFRNVTILRRTLIRRLLFDAIGWTGLGWLPLKLLQRLRTKATPSTTLESFDEFGKWADELWERCRGNYMMIGCRTADVLNILYPPTDKRFIRLKVSRGQEVIGWVVMLNTQMTNHKQFGAMRVGSIIDNLSTPENVDLVIAAATNWLEQAGADILVSNQAHKDWGIALKNSGFLSGPSNYILAVSPELSRLLEPFDTNCKLVHINRGDGDGPVHL